MTATFLSYLSDYQSKAQTYLEEHSTDVIIVTGTAAISVVIANIWGKFAAASFAAVAFASRSLLRKQIEILSHVDMNAPAQVAAVGSIPLLTLFNPPAGVLMAATVAAAIINREWRLAQANKKLADENATLKKDNTTLSTLYTNIKNDIETLEKALNQCLKRIDTPENVLQLQDQLSALQTKIKHVATLCNDAISSERLLERIHTALELQKQLKQLIDQCTAHTQAIGSTHQDIEQLKTTLQEKLLELLASINQES